MKTGKKIFFDSITGVQIVDTGEWSNVIREKTVVEEIASYPALSERNRTTFDVLELAFGAFEQDFRECTGYRVNVTTRTLEFSYPDPNAPLEPPVFVKPLSEQVLELKQGQAAINRAVDDNSTAQQGLLELLIDMGVL